MALYLMIGFDRHPHQMSLRDSIRQQHRDYVLANNSKIRMAGAMMDDNGNQYGTMIVFDAESADEVWNWIRKEPFYCAGVYETMAVRKWNLVIGAIADPAK